jgi:hypothetical protein
MAADEIRPNPYICGKFLLLIFGFEIYVYACICG